MARLGFACTVHLAKAAAFAAFGLQPQSGPKQFGDEVGRDLVEDPKKPACAKAQQREGPLLEPVAQRAAAQFLGQLVCVEPALHGGGKADERRDLAVLQMRFADLVVPVGVAVVDQLARSPVVVRRDRFSTQQPEVCALETL